MPPNPPSNAHGFAMRSMSLRDMQILKSEKKISWPPPLPNPGDAPGVQNIFRKWRYLHGAKRHAAHGQGLLGGSGAYSPGTFLKNMLFGAFWRIFC